MIRRPLAALLALSATLALAACGEKDEPDAAARPDLQKLTVVLDYFPNADHVGIYAAQAEGLFEKAGLDVRIEVPGDAASPLKLLQAGRADLAITYEPEVFLARQQGARVVGVAALANRPLTSLMALGSSGIKRVADLKGKTVGTAGIPYQTAYLTTLLKKNGVDPSTVKQVDIGFDLVPAMLTKKVDATLGAFWNYEGIQLAQEGKDPTIIRMDQAGVPTYDELVLASTEETLREPDKGALVRRFIQAVQQGTKAVRADPSVGVDPLLKANRDLDRKLQEAAVKASLPVFFPTEADQPFGYQDTEQWRRFGRWMLDNGLIETPPTDALLTNEFLPGEGVRPADDDTPGGDGS